MNQMLMGVVVILGMGSYYLYQQNQTLAANNLQLESAIATQQEAIETMEADFLLQTGQLQEMTAKSQKAQLELNRYNQFIQNYELAAKIIADPVEMQRKINNGTKHIMESIEDLSGTVDGLDNGLQLQSDSN